MKRDLSPVVPTNRRLSPVQATRMRTILPLRCTILKQPSEPRRTTPTDPLSLSLLKERRFSPVRTLTLVRVSVRAERSRTLTSRREAVSRREVVSRLPTLPCALVLERAPVSVPFWSPILAVVPFWSPILPVVVPLLLVPA